MLTDVQLESMAEKMRIPLEGVYFKDQLPKLKYNRAYIVNMMDEIQKRVCLIQAAIGWRFKLKKVVMIFDPCT